MLNNRHVEIATAIPSSAWKPIGDKGNTFEGDISTDEGRKAAYVKLLPSEGVIKEALCAVLAKELGLPITQPYFVDLSNIRNFFAGRRYSTPGFGLERSRVPSFKIRTEGAQEALLKWPELLRCAVFDIWIGNADRYPSTNMTFERNGTIWIFDHDDALAAHLMPTTSVRSQLLQLLIEGKTELQLYGLRRDSLQIVGEMSAVNWEQVAKYVSPSAVSDGVETFRRYQRFLEARVRHMPALINEGLGLRQGEMFPLMDSRPSRNEQ